MFDPSNHTHFSLTLDHPEADFQVLSFKGREAISQPYRFELELVSERPDLDLHSLLHRTAFLAFDPAGHGLHGQVQQAAQGDPGRRLHRYQLVLVPRLAYLAHRHNLRIFQQQSVPQIITRILQEHGIQADAFRFALGTPCPVREYCVQYRESDLHFVQRLCEEEGLHYHFEHSRDGHLLVFGDDQVFFPRLGRSLAYVQDTGLAADTPAIRHFGVRLQTRTRRVSRRDHDFERPRLTLEASCQPDPPPEEVLCYPEPDLEDYAYPGRFGDRRRGRLLSRRALERHRADQHLASGRSDAPQLASGHFFELAGHPRVEWNDLWLLTEVQHEGYQPQVLEEAMPGATGQLDQTADEAPRQGYRNRFLATPWNVFYRPPLRHPKPQVLGSQSAVVTGPPGEEIYCDKYGRVKVQFFWDREGAGDETSSCWLRVASSWAGVRYGGLAVPRVGMEVLVSFFEGDPDQPLVSGCLYHAENRVPYELPEHKTRSVFKSASSPGGQGCNELRIEDRRGAEQIYVHAQRDWDAHIGHDQKLHVGHQRHDTVHDNSYSLCQGEEHRTTVGDRKTALQASDHLSVDGNQHVKVGGSQRVEAGREIHIKAGERLLIEADLELTLSVGGSFIKLDPGGVTVVGEQILFNSGGSPGVVSGLALQTPTLPVAPPSADTGAPPAPAQANVRSPSEERPSKERFFDIALADVPGDEGFPLRQTAWQIVQETGQPPLLEGVTDQDGRVQIDEPQRLELSAACARGEPLWLCYAGQRVPIAVHEAPAAATTQAQAQTERLSQAAQDFHDSPRQRPLDNVATARGHQAEAASSTPYNGVRHKELTQVNTADGKAMRAVSAPDFFVRDPNAFAPKRSGHDVRFFTTGKDYYLDLAQAIGQARTSIFITGWQVNYDVTLDGKQSLWQCLRTALMRSSQLKVFVMPWLSPAASVGTHDFETMLAIFHLNAGLKEPRAFCTPAIQQSDMKGLGSTFSHHQKAVVIDNHIGYVGGIDLAYGRRDDNDFSLDASDRRGNDAYNPCIPHLGWMPMHEHVSRAGLLLATLFDLSGTGTTGVLNAATWVRDFFASPRHPVLEWMVKGGRSLKEQFAAFDPLAAPRQYLTDLVIRSITALIKDNWRRLPLAEPLKGQVEGWIAEVDQFQGALHVDLRLKSQVLISQWMNDSDLGRLVAMFCDKGYDAMPADKLGWLAGLEEVAIALLGHFYALLQSRLENRQAPFRYLEHEHQPLASADYSTLAKDQPRMPWQDVHSRIEGPAVYDLARNFIDRWNGQQAYIADIQPLEKTAVVVAFMEWLNRLARDAGLPHHLGLDDRIRLEMPKPRPVWIDQPQDLPRPPTTVPGKVSVQVLRSASARMLAQEAKGRAKAQVELPQPPGTNAGGVQADCYHAMLQAISSAQHFLYIENQFFQSDFGKDGELNDKQDLSGPMASLRDPLTLRQDFVERINLREALERQDFALIDWKEVKAIGKSPDKEAYKFLEDLRRIWQTNAQGWLTQKLGRQEPLGNTIGQALADRIGRAIDEDLPFHVYLVLPVHPEGTLDTLNVMHQVHLTQQSLVFGQHSLVRRIQRRMALKAVMARGASREEALAIIERVDGNEQPAYAHQDWTRYLTLLNLRTWTTLRERVVTEQIYVHSKLLIADDRVAILGSANINDRSLRGMRDSELAVIVRDSESVEVRLDGQHLHPVGRLVHQLRKDLWKKHFGMSQTRVAGVAPFEVDEDFLEQPASEAVWRAIQQRARDNSKAYEAVFNFIPQNFSQFQVIEESMRKKYREGFPASIWPTWTYKTVEDLNLGGQLEEPPACKEEFWVSRTRAGVKFHLPPQGIQGFITALPTGWTKGENNDSGLNLTILAGTEEGNGAATVASTDRPATDSEQV